MNDVELASTLVFVIEMLFKPNLLMQLCTFSLIQSTYPSPPFQQTSFVTCCISCVIQSIIININVDMQVTWKCWTMVHSKGYCVCKHWAIVHQIPSPFILIMWSCDTLRLCIYTYKYILLYLYMSVFVSSWRVDLVSVNVISWI